METCKNGHPRTPENTFWCRTGYRQCIPCRQEAHRRFVAANPAVVREYRRREYERDHDKILARARAARAAKRESKPRRPIGIMDAFDSKVEAISNGCWIWLGHITKDGYGKLGIRLAHRLAYEALMGPIPDGLELDHLCRRRDCVNPLHHDPVTHEVNLGRRRMRRIVG